MGKHKKAKAHSPSQKPFYDVVICGAGISGLYSAWRLLSSKDWHKQFPNKKPRVAVLELSNRIGGRIETVHLDASMAFPSELGAMRFLDHHLIVNLLVQKFALPTERFTPSERKSYFLRGKHLVENDFKESQKVPYNLLPEEQGKSPDELLHYALNKILPDYAQYSIDELRSLKNQLKFNGKGIKDIELYKIGFSNALQDVLSHEAFLLVKDGGGYDSNVMNWNTAEAVSYLVENFKKTVGSAFIQGGTSRLPEALAREVVRLGGEILINTRMLGFDFTSETDSNAPIDCRIVQAPNSPIEIQAGKLILAMPQRSLELLEQNNSFFRNEEIQKLIRSVHRQPAFKLFFSYGMDWWKDCEKGDSVIISDLPLRMTYYYPSRSKHKQNKNYAKESMLMIYEDMDPDYYWQNLYSKDPTLQKTFGGQSSPKKMIEAVQAKLCEIHGRDILPQPSHSLFRDWSIDPFGGGYHVWRPDFDAVEVMNKIRHADETRHVYICGEAYSNAQSWMEGALKTAESLLRDFFGVERLENLPADYNLIDENVNQTHKKKRSAANDE